MDDQKSAEIGNERNPVGTLQVYVTSAIGMSPIENAKVEVSYAGQSEQSEKTVFTDSSGQTSPMILSAPPVIYSLDSQDVEQPYAEYTVTVTAPGYQPVTVSGTEILAGQNAIQPITMNPNGSAPEKIVIGSHTLFGDYPPKIPEAEIKPVDETGEIVLSRVVIPEYIVVHNGPPADKSAKNYYIKYKDYIKNVVSSEIYATWPESAIYANILAIQSFTLNRVYTEWYRNKGYSFTITNSTAYDQSFVYGRNIYSNIDRLVNTVFSNYLSRPGIRQPLFASYCNGTTATCNGLSQWGSKYLADRGYSAIEILRYYYGSDVYINSADGISGVPSSYPGYQLTIGSRGTKVAQMQEQLNRIARNYPAIPKLTADGIFGSKTAASVRKFQSIFGLPATGIVDYPTWYRISEIYVGVSRISEPGT